MTTELEAQPAQLSPAVDQLLIDLAEMDIVFDVYWRRIDQLEAENKELKATVTKAIDELISLRGVHYDCDDIQPFEEQDRDRIDALIAAARGMVKL